MSDLALVDNDDWFDIGAKSAKAAALPEVTFRLSAWGDTGKVRAHISFRRAAFEALQRLGTRFRVQMAGDLDRLRIVPDPTGPLEVIVVKGVGRFSLGHIAALPNEIREAEACDFAIRGGALLVTLPADYGRPRAGAMHPDSAPPRVKPQAKVINSPIKLSTAAAGLSAQARIIDRRPTGPVHLGEPAPGRSALDQRKAAASS